MAGLGMQILPAIDILGGRVVRLARGDYEKVTVYHEDPIRQAQEFKAQGATWIHMVDLDGARTGEPINHRLIHQIIRSTGLMVEVGGGVRSIETIDTLAKAGASRIVIGTKLITDPDFAQQAVSLFGDLICAGVDARDGSVAIAGWREDTSVPAIVLIKELFSWGIRHLVYTDISKDGMQTGIDVEVYRKVAQAAGFPVIASGGISSLNDLRLLQDLGDEIVEGAIVGRAIYEGVFTVTEALVITQQHDQKCTNEGKLNES